MHCGKAVEDDDLHGFPFTVFAPRKDDLGVPIDNNLLRNRADLVSSGGTGPVLRGADRISHPGAEEILNDAAFKEPEPGQVGNLGRNALIGPGFWNVDLSLAKSVPATWLGDSGRIQVRADFFNAFNHTNLGTSDSDLTSPDFGLARWGRSGFESPFRASTILSETPRQIELQLKVYF